MRIIIANFFMLFLVISIKIHDTNGSPMSIELNDIDAADDGSPLSVDLQLDVNNDKEKNGSDGCGGKQEPPKPAGCPTDFTQNGANCYWFSKNKGEKTSWTVAKQKCDALGTQIKKNVHLAELGTKGNGDSDIWLMETISATRDRAWVGASLKNNQKWVWEYSGRTLELNFPFWAPSEPNASGAQCVNAWPTGNKHRDYLADDTCTGSMFYVCQIFD